MAKALRTVMLVLLLVVAGSVAVPAHAGPARDVPIRGSVDGADAIDFTAPGCPTGTSWSFETIGSGTVSHLGNVDFVLGNCTTMQPSGILTIEGTITFTAANGDLLVIAHQGTAAIDGFTATAVYAWQVAEGTGRFDGASGSGESMGVTHIPNPGGPEGGTSQIVLHGSISYDASSRAAR